MELSLPAPELSTYVARQLSSVFPDESVSPSELERPLAVALERTAECFSQIRVKYFVADGLIRFNHLHTDQYAMFLYLLSNTLHRMGAPLAAKVYALNKALHGIDAFHEVDLPQVFLFQHPVGTVLGRGTYGNYFFVYQRCSVGASLDGHYPRIGEGVVMFGGSAIIGNCSVGDNCWLSVGTVVMDSDIPPGSVVFGRSPNLDIKPTRRDVVREFFLRS